MVLRAGTTLVQCTVLDYRRQLLSDRRRGRCRIRRDVLVGSALANRASSSRSLILQQWLAVLLLITRTLRSRANRATLIRASRSGGSAVVLKYVHKY